MSLIKHIESSVKSVFIAFFSNDMDVISDETKRVLANPEDKLKYLNAINDLKKLKRNSNGNEKVSTKIKLSNDSEIELSL